MTKEEFIQKIVDARWLSNCQGVCNIDPDNDWEWLPSSRDQDNPFALPSRSIEKVDILRDKEFEREAIRTTMESIRSIQATDKKLNDGPHNFKETFKGAAIYCVRFAAKEIVQGKPGKWVEIFQQYEQGMWPCGFYKNGDIFAL
jgi:hypothetical protein